MAVNETGTAAVGALLILGAAQFLMIRYTMVMNVSIATMTEDVGRLLLDGWRD